MDIFSSSAGSSSERKVSDDTAHALFQLTVKYLQVFYDCLPSETLQQIHKAYQKKYGVDFFESAEEIFAYYEKKLEQLENKSKRDY